MEDLLIDYASVTINLIDSIEILGLSVKTLHSNPYSDLLIEGKDSAPPELLVQIPPTAEEIGSQELDVKTT